MKIVQTDEIPLKRGLEHRGGIFHGRIMVEGEPGALDNFQLSFEIGRASCRERVCLVV